MFIWKCLPTLLAELGLTHSLPEALKSIPVKLVQRHLQMLYALGNGSRMGKQAVFHAVSCHDFSILPSQTLCFEEPGKAVVASCSKGRLFALFVMDPDAEVMHYEPIKQAEHITPEKGKCLA